MKKSILFFGLLAGTAGFLKAQNVNIPDANFKAYLVGNTSINTNGDNEIQISEAEVYTGTINVVSQNITDLTGIEAFVNITYLECSFNPLINLDVSKNTALTKLWCRENQLVSLDVSYNTALQELRASRNNLSFVDVSNLNNLVELNVQYNNNLSSVIIGNNKPNLSKISLNDSSLTSIDINNYPALTLLQINNNLLTELDLSHNPLLEWINVSDNNLSSLNVKNGNNVNITIFYASNNPNLTCIQVDNPSASYLDNWQKDPTASYNTDCLLSVTDINKKEIAIYPNPVKETLHFSEEVSNVKIIDVSGRTVKEFSAKGKSVNIANLAKGIYIISAVTKSGEMVTKKIVKE